MIKEFQKVRKFFYFPQLPKPQLVEDLPNEMINMKSLEIKVNQPFIEGLRKKGIARKNKDSDTSCVNEYLTHQMIHFMVYPGCVLDVLKLQKAGQEIIDGEHKVSTLRTAFIEAQTTICMTNEIKHPATSKIRKAYGLSEGDVFGKLMYGLYQKVSNQNFGVKLTKEEKRLVNQLREINFLNKNQETESFKKFAQILRDYPLPKDKTQKRKYNGLEIFTNNQIREGLKQFAQECSNPNEYEEVVRQVLREEDKEEKGEQPVPTIVYGSGTERGITQLAGNFYTARAEKYTIPIRKKPMHKNGSLYPHSHTSFQVGDPITEVDAFSTPGILPGITKKWVMKEGKVFDNEEAVPDSFLVIDNSPSMQSPVKEISIPVLGATAISNTYFHNNSKVAVYSFGSNDHLTNPTKNRELVHRELRRYSSNGGTTFNRKVLEKILKQNEGEFDISVISDMAISNLDSFVNAVLEIPQTHRIHLLYTKNNEYVNKLRQSFGNIDNVAILPLICERDIYDITMGELKKSIK